MERFLFMIVEVSAHPKYCL